MLTISIRFKPTGKKNNKTLNFFNLPTPLVSVFDDVDFRPEFNNKITATGLPWWCSG